MAASRGTLGAALAGALTVTLALAPGAQALDRPELVRSLDRSLDRARTPALSAEVRDLTTGATLYARQGQARRIPASVQKLYTTATVLQQRGANARIVTRVVRDGTVDDGALGGDLVLVGDGDPTLDRAAIERLALAVRRSGIRRVSGSVLGDESRFDALRGGPRTGGLYDRDIGGVLGALTIGRGFSAKPGGPALAAARALARALRASGVRVRGRTAAGAAPQGARVVARSRSLPMSELVRRTNQPSDNFYAETLLKGLGVPGGGAGTTESGGAGTTQSGAAVVRAELAELGLAPQIADGSGLARANRTSAADVVRLLAAMHASANAAPFEASLAVAGRSGTLRRRLRSTAAAGACRGKTGTLNRVSSLAGLCVTRQGHTLAFALLLNGVTTWRGQLAQDRALRTLVAYRAPVISPTAGRAAR